MLKIRNNHNYLDPYFSYSGLYGFLVPFITEITDTVCFHDYK